MEPFADGTIAYGAGDGQHAHRGLLAPLCNRSATSLCKRSADVVGATLVLIPLLPLLLLVALAIVLTSRGPVLFRQNRTGLNGRVFRIAKFRTMHVLEDGEELRHATRADSRTTRVGALLRRTSIDELPQLFNILLGDMSFVGPRPHAVAHDTYYGTRLPGYRLRFAARPGLTGLAQVRGMRGEVRTLAGMAERVAADREYIANWSFRLDLTIALRTLPRLLFDRAAY